MLCSATVDLSVCASLVRLLCSLIWMERLLSPIQILPHSCVSHLTLHSVSDEGVGGTILTGKANLRKTSPSATLDTTNQHDKFKP